MSFTPPSSTSDLGAPDMEFTYFHNEFPKGDLQTIFRQIHRHSKDRRYRPLADFIQEATVVAKEEIQRLPAETRTLFPAFDSILAWSESPKLREGLLCGALDGALLIVAQLAIYIGYAINRRKELIDFEGQNVTGLGLGLLSASAVSLSSSLSDLSLAGADAVRLALRLGFFVADVSEGLEARDLTQSPDTWAYVVHNVDSVTSQKELDSFHARSRVPATGKIFISAVAQSSVTVSGPPAKLKALFNKSEFYRTSRYIALPVYGGLCHAPHIYNEQHIRTIVRHGGQLYTMARKVWPRMAVYSTSTGSPYPAKDAAELFELVVAELLTKCITWDRVINGVVNCVKDSAACSVALSSFGNSLPLNELRKELYEVKIISNDLISWLSDVIPVDTAPRGSAQSKLAIVGMSCRLPGGATSSEKFWDILEKGLDVSRRIPADRFDIDTHYDPTGKQLNKSMTQYGCFIDEPGLFDAPFFNMSPREAQVVDPQMRLALVTAYEALEQSGFIGNRTPSTRLERVGTYYGQAADDYREVNQGQEVSTYYIPGGCRAFGPGRINYFFKFAGPSYSIDTACSSGLAAIELACQALWNGDVDTAVAGGVNILTNPDGFTGLCHGHFLTKGHNACKTWDATADGYCRADGVGSLVIKKLEDANADNDNILGVILAAGTNHSAEAVSITHPHAGHQVYLSRQVLRQAGVDPLDVSYVELHGTGTQAGDHEEMQGIMEVYAPLNKRRSKDQPLRIGGVKSNIGHGESVAGTAALIKVLLMLQKNAIPRHIGIKTEMNPRFPKDFDKRNLHIPFEMTPWPRIAGRRRIAAINNFGAAGGNTTMILEESQIRDITEMDPREACVVCVSAKTKMSLAKNIERLLHYLDENPDTKLIDLSYTTTARRYHHAFRIAVATSTMDQLKKQLSSQLQNVDSVKPMGKSGPHPVAFVFTGQGASYKSMDLQLYRDVPTFREHINRLDSLAQGQGFPSFIPALDGSHPKDHAHSPVVTQLALVCSEIALAYYWMSLGLKPDCVMGHSLGEFAAMHVAGVTSASDTIFMAGVRAQMLQERCKPGSHCMMAVRASQAQIAAASAGKPYAIACSNGPSDTVLSGTREQIESMSASLEASGYKCFVLEVAFAFHSEQMDPILDDFEAICKTGVIFKEPRMPLISPLLGKVIFNGKTLSAKYVRRATRETVNFLSALNSAQQVATVADDTVWVEIGPHPVCINFIKSVIPSTVTAVPSCRRTDNDWKTLADSLATLHTAGVGINWNEFHGPFEGRLRLLDLPAYSWNEKNYWLQYNGDWCLTKGNNFYAAEKACSLPKVHPRSEVATSTVQQIIEQSFNGSAGTIVMQSDLMQPDFQAAADGHRMNNCGVVTSSIHADIAYTLGNHLLTKLRYKSKNTDISICNLHVVKGLVANADRTSAQLIRVTATTADINSCIAGLTWQNVDNDGTVSEPFATANIVYGNSAEWLSSWGPRAHLIHGRIEALERLAAEGKANRFSRNIAYNIFGANLVDYADKYRGMQSVVMHELEGFADVQLTTKETGVWTVAPYFIDSVAHLAGFIMNCSDAMDTKKNYCVTPGWKSMSFAKPLVAGAKYRSYVKMIPAADDANAYFGDVYVLQDDVIVGLVEGIEFHSYPRILLGRFFSAPDKTANRDGSKHQQATCPQTSTAAPLPQSPLVTVQKDVNIASPAPAAPELEPAPADTKTKPTAGDSIANKALQLIANEAGLEVSELDNDASFNNLGVDSLMSLVIVEKFRVELDVKVGGSLFLDYPTIGDLRKWLDDYYG